VVNLLRDPHRGHNGDGCSQDPPSTVYAAINHYAVQDRTVTAGCDFAWDSDTFPDPAGMLSRLKRQGLRISAWINPYIAQKSAMFEEGMCEGHLVRRPDGSVWQWDLWQPGMALVDFTNPAARDWYTGKLKTLLHPPLQPGRLRRAA
jgi:alpha-glucosidase (family GH31 glycosyl hydrolase)